MGVRLTSTFEIKEKKGVWKQGGEIFFGFWQKKL